MEEPNIIPTSTANRSKRRARRVKRLVAFVQIKVKVEIFLNLLLLLLQRRLILRRQIIVLQLDSVYYVVLTMVGPGVL